MCLVRIELRRTFNSIVSPPTQSCASSAYLEIGHLITRWTSEFKCLFLPQICRLQRHLSAGEHQQDLFQGQPPMFVSKLSQPPTQGLVELIELCGGTACKTVRQAGICIGKYSGRRPEGSRILSEQWVLGKTVL